jgi:ribonuclease HI
MTTDTTFNIIKIYVDRPAKEEKAAAGIWKEIPNLHFAFRAVGDQTSYNRELQGAIYSVMNAKA